MVHRSDKLWYLAIFFGIFIREYLFKKIKMKFYSMKGRELR